MIRLYVFDLGNVILPFENRPIAEKLCEHSAMKGRAMTDSFFSYMFDYTTGFINPYEEGLMSSMEFFVHLKRRYKLSIDLDQFKNIWNPIFREDTGVSRFLRHLKDRGYPIFLLSNTNELHFTYIMEKYPIVHIFDEWILSFEVGAKKPAKRIYDTIFERMDVPPHEVFFVDDIPEYVETAKSYGMNGMVFKDAEGLWEAFWKQGR